jgi:hypothetical protein
MTDTAASTRRGAEGEAIMNDAEAVVYLEGHVAMSENVTLKQENDELRQQVVDLQLTTSSFPDTAWANICGEFWEDKKNQYMLNADDTVDPEDISTNDLVPGGEGCYIDLRKLYKWTEDHGLHCPKIPDVETVISDGEWMEVASSAGLVERLASQS